MRVGPDIRIDRVRTARRRGLPGRRPRSFSRKTPVGVVKDGAA